MADLLAFPRRIDATGGTIHVYPVEGGGYEIGHESRSGNSWGNFASFACPQAAIAAGYALNRDEMGGDCEVFISSEVLAALPPSPPVARGAF